MYEGHHYHWNTKFVLGLFIFWLIMASQLNEGMKLTIQATVFLCV